MPPLGIVQSSYQTERRSRLSAKDKLIVALDVEAPAKALDLVRELHGVAGMFKVGSQLFTLAGPQIVKDILALNTKVFLDLKFHDIPHQVAGAARSAAELGVSLFTIHASGGSEMMQRAVESVTEVAARTGSVRSRVLAISVLTSIDATILAQIGISTGSEESVLRLVRLAEAAGVDGVVSSPKEIKTIRDAVSNPEFLVVTPGIRPAETESQREDQKRVATPQAAIAAGASYLVVGRPITGASDPAAAALRIVAEMERGEGTELSHTSSV
jgi:orotidine-5'-phosphate decarboxylase